MEIHGRTDLASEARGIRMREGGAAGALRGVRAGEYRLHNLPVTSVEILDEEGARALGKAPGHYDTLSLPAPLSRGDTRFADGAAALAELLGRRLPEEREGGVLIAALGNPDVTPDALGSLAAGSLLVTRHLKREEDPAFRGFASTLLCRTGVLGTTGVESAVQIRALCGALHPSCVLAIDALAGSELAGLCRSVQICDTGIAPGSGVGNDREALDRASLGVPVIAVGVPTVIDASALAAGEELGDLFVTPRFIDSAVRSIARLIAYGVNLALHPRLTLADIDLLVG
jgi:spore protease